MCGDNPVKEIGGGQWDSWNTYHTTGTTQLTIYRQTNELIPANPVCALKSGDVSKTVFTQPQRGNTSHPIFKTRQWNRAKLESALINTTMQTFWLDVPHTSQTKLACFLALSGNDFSCLLKKTEPEHTEKENFISLNISCAARLNAKDWHKRHWGSTDTRLRQKVSG